MDPYVRQFFAKPYLSSGTSPPPGPHYEYGNAVRGHSKLCMHGVSGPGPNWFKIGEGGKFGFNIAGGGGVSLVWDENVLGNF